MSQQQEKEEVQDPKLKQAGQIFTPFYISNADFNSKKNKKV